jgi:hypothetical protein
VFLVPSSRALNLFRSWSVRALLFRAGLAGVVLVATPSCTSDLEHRLAGTSPVADDTPEARDAGFSPNDDMGGAPNDDMGGAPNDDMGGAPNDDMGGAPNDDMGGAPNDDMGGAPNDDMGGASGGMGGAPNGGMGGTGGAPDGGMGGVPNGGMGGTSGGMGGAPNGGMGGTGGAPDGGMGGAPDGGMGGVPNGGMGGAPPQPVLTFSLWSADTNRDLPGYIDVLGAVEIITGMLPDNHNISVNVSPDLADVAELVFDYDSALRFRVEGTPPYFLGPASVGSVGPLAPALDLGAQIIVVHARNSDGAEIASATLVITVTN